MWQAPDEKRLAQVPVSEELLIVSFMKNGIGSDFDQRITVAEGVPNDAELYASYQNGNIVYFVFEHESFDPIRQGEKIPIVTPIQHEEHKPSIEYGSDMDYSEAPEDK